MIDLENILIIFRFFGVVLSLLGFSLYINRKFKIKKEFTLILVIAVISIILVIAGILNIMKYISFLLYFSGMFLFIYEFIKCDKRKIFSINNIVIGVIIVYFAIMVMQMHLEHYDNFSHWALIVKNMLQTDMLPNFESELIMFKSYPPATACFIYFVCKFVGNTDISMMLGQILITVSASVAVLGIVNERMKNKFLYSLIIILIISTLFNIYIGIVPYNELLVDVVLTLVGVASTIMLFYYSKQMKKLIVINIIFAIFLMLIKNSGAFFVLLNFIVTIFLLVKNNSNKDKKLFVKIIILLVIIPLLTLVIWKQHVKYAYGDDAINSKHSMSISNYIKNFTDKSSEEIIDVTNNYLQKVFDTKDINFKIIMLINIIMLAYVMYNFFKKDNERFKENLKFILLINFIYVLYLIVLYIMYLVSMPAGEAASIGGYSRYVFTVLSYLFMIFIIKIIKDIQVEQNITMLSVVSLIIIIFNIFNIIGNSNKGFLIGKDNYEIGDRKKFDEIIYNKDIIPNSNYIIYAPNTNLESGYLYFIGKYLLNTNGVYFVKEINNIDLSQFDYIIIYDEDDSIIDTLKKYDIIYTGKGIYDIEYN